MQIWNQLGVGVAFGITAFSSLTGLGASLFLEVLKMVMGSGRWDCEGEQGPLYHRSLIRHVLLFHNQASS